MTSSKQEMHGFDSVSNELAGIKAGSRIGAYHTAHEIWLRLGWGDSPYVEGCRKACKMYFKGGKPDRKVMDGIRSGQMADIHAGKTSCFDA